MPTSDQVELDVVDYEMSTTVSIHDYCVKSGSWADHYVTSEGHPRPRVSLRR